ncbi:exodeoxyribonuclease VII large subunit [[Clostridium] polysaccharolyticum]|uniref:Exodeoxyribonuclease 7 large subunit n=1 Tax=[Clostridium] polysaccharolyticum TaxID=29364 RepID=A0A1I0A0B4_9FIRM|nr:exodeoxyribonuclease VII large subunit [[Clostridium] polysaccharolyticum]SES87489.1 Exodeoxyribonuclease VII large subunit [[Clostridium] polysaccharolyticum]
MEKRNAYTVSKINQYIKNMFLSDYALNRIYVKGEVSNLKYHTSGHIYFTLKDEKSQMACVMFAGQRSGLRFRMTEGQNIIVFGNISVYERDGKYQLYASEIILDGLGSLYEKFEQLKKSLEQEGLFSKEHKKPIPFYAKKIGIVTASTGAAIQDIVNIAARRNPYAELILYPAKVQGEGAAQTIVEGIKTLDALKLDVLIVGRGGGSIEDLWAFNEESVARALFQCKTPVISAVGHETDTTIADFAADLRAPTPSAGAELAVCNIQEVFAVLEDYETNLFRLMERKIQEKRYQLDNCRLRLAHQSPAFQIQQHRQYASDLEEKLNDRMKQVLEKKKHQLALYIEKMKGLSPLEKLSKGYSFVTDGQGNAVKTVKTIKQGDAVTIAVTDGKIQAVAVAVTQEKR